MRPFILFAAIALFSQMGVIKARSCQMNTPSRLDISSNNTFVITVTYPYHFPCNLTVEEAHATDGKVYGSTNCKNFKCEKFVINSPVCTAEYVVEPQCTGWHERCVPPPTISLPFTLNSIQYKDCPADLIFACSGNVCENDQISDGTGPGCYCKNTNAYLYQKDGTCLDPTEAQCMPCLDLQCQSVCNNNCVCSNL